MSIVYVRREKLATWHVSESTIADAAITNCGRRMEPDSSERGSLVYADIISEEQVDSLCRLCRGAT